MIHKFKKSDELVPVIAITESGSDMMLIIAYVGVVEYDRADSEFLARRLENAAAMVRKQA